MNSLQSLKKQLTKLREQKQPIILQLQSRLQAQQQMIRKLTEKLLVYQQKTYIDQLSVLENLDQIISFRDGSMDRKFVVIDITALPAQAVFVCNVEARVLGSRDVGRVFGQGLGVGGGTGNGNGDGGGKQSRDWSGFEKDIGVLQEVVSQLRAQMNELKRKYQQNVDQNLLSMTVNKRKQTFSTPQILLKQSSLGWSSDKSKLDPIKEQKKSFDLSIAEISSQSMGDDKYKDKSLNDSPDSLRKQNSLPPQGQPQLKKEQKLKSGRSDDKKNLIMEQQKQSQSEREKSDKAPQQNSKKQNQNEASEYQDLAKVSKSRGNSRDRASSKKENQLKLTTYLDRHDSKIDEKIEKAPLRKMIDSESKIEHKVQQKEEKKEEKKEELKEEKKEEKVVQSVKSEEQPQEELKAERIESGDEKNKYTSLEASIINVQAKTKQHETASEPVQPIQPTQPIQQPAQAPQSQPAPQPQPQPSQQLHRATTNIQQVQQTQQADQKSDPVTKHKSAPVDQNSSIELKLTNASPKIEPKNQISSVNLNNMSETVSVGSFQLVGNGGDLKNSVDKGKDKDKEKESEGASEDKSVKAHISDTSSQHESLKQTTQNLSPIKHAKQPTELSHISQISQNEKSNKNESGSEFSNLLALGKEKEGATDSARVSQKSEKSAIPIQLIQSTSSNNTAGLGTPKQPQSPQQIQQQKEQIKESPKEEEPVKAPETPVSAQKTIEKSTENKEKQIVKEPIRERQYEIQIDEQKKTEEKPVEKSQYKKEQIRFPSIVVQPATEVLQTKEQQPRKSDGKQEQKRENGRDAKPNWDSLFPTFSSKKKDERESQNSKDKQKEKRKSRESSNKQTPTAQVSEPENRQNQNSGTTNTKTEQNSEESKPQDSQISQSSEKAISPIEQPPKQQPTTPQPQPQSLQKQKQRQSEQIHKASTIISKDSNTSNQSYPSTVLSEPQAKLPEKEKSKQKEKAHGAQDLERESRHKKKEKHPEKASNLNWGSLFAVGSTEKKEKKPKQNKEKESAQKPQTSQPVPMPEQKEKDNVAKQDAFETPKKEKQPDAQHSIKQAQSKQNQLQKTPAWKLNSPESPIPAPQPQQEASKPQISSTQSPQQKITPIQSPKPEDQAKPEEKARYSFQKKPQQTPQSNETKPQSQPAQKLDYNDGKPPVVQMNEKNNEEQYQKLKKQSKQAELKQQEELDRLLQQLHEEEMKEKAKNKNEEREQPQAEPRVQINQVKAKEEEEEPVRVEEVDINSQIKDLFNFGGQSNKKSASKSERKKSIKVDKVVQPPVAFMNTQSPRVRDEQKPKSFPEEQKFDNFLAFSADLSEKSDKDKNRNDGKQGNEDKDKYVDIPIEALTKRKSQQPEKHEVATKFAEPYAEQEQKADRQFSVKKKPTINIKPASQSELKLPESFTEQFVQKTPYPQPYMKKISELSQKEINVENFGEEGQTSQPPQNRNTKQMQNEQKDAEGKFTKRTAEPMVDDRKDDKKKPKSKVIHFRKGG